MFALRPYLLLSALIGCSSFLFSQNHTNFSHLSPTLNNRVIDVSQTIQDEQGNIWMVYGSGILVYDGYNYTLVKNNVIFPNKKENDAIDDIIIDNHKNMWIISNFGMVSMYNVATGQFEDPSHMLNGNVIKAILAKEENVWLVAENGTIYRSEYSNIDSIVAFNGNTSLEKIFDIEQGNTGDLYISTEQGKIFCYSSITMELRELVGPFTDFPGNLVLATDNVNRLWIGTETYGLFVYDISNKRYVQDSFFKKKRFNINNEMFLNLVYDDSGYMWGGTDGGGLYKVNTATGDIDIFTKQHSNEFSLSTNTILDVSKDDHENIWITTNYGELNVLPNTTNNISYHEGSENNIPSRILSIFKSTTGVLWVGTDGSGLTKIITNEDGTTTETQYFNNMSHNRGFYVQSITEDEQLNIWFGTYKNGLWVYDVKTDAFNKINISNSYNQEATDIRTVFTDSKGRIWAGSNISINVYSPDLTLLSSFENNVHGLQGTIVESIVEDENGVIWLGLYRGGLFQFNEDQMAISNSNFIDYSFYDKNNKNEIDAVKSMVLGARDEIWLINDHRKLLKFNTKRKTYDTYEHLESIKEQNFSSILKSDSNNLWMSSYNGISHLDLKNAILKTYYSTDGLQDNFFLPRSAFKDENGMLYFGGIKGLNSFNPKKIKKKEANATLYINGIEILNQPVSSLLPEQIGSGIYNIESLHLEHDQASFSFRFSAIDNILNPNFYYTYRLKGFDEDWVTSQSERLATYTNVPSGNYIFEVKAGVKKGTWNIFTKPIAISIEPPMWDRTEAYIIYLCILGLFVYATYRWYMLTKKLFLEKISHKKEHELHSLKMNFFTKMSHEIQTPITLILGPIEDMLKRAEQNGNLLLEQRLNIIGYNANRLSKIARELTLVRNKELEKLRLNVTKNNLFKDIDDISMSFKELARKRCIDFIINCPKNLPEAWYDSEKFEHVIYNLLSNAFKFTPKEGNIQLNIVPINSKRNIKLSVVNSGPGIPKEELNNIFELFYQSKEGKKSKGTGIGLALTKDLIDLHRGTIEVDSTPIDGTVFTITVPITKNAYDESDRIITDASEQPNSEVLVENVIRTDQKEVDLSKKTILIVEDNYGLQELLKELLSPEYNIILAENGEEGYYYAKSNFPDLILSDVMMPKLDGIEMCRKLQEDDLTMHVPVILITAMNSTNVKISGLKSGAIEYIRKPFNTNELQLKVKNIILSRERIISKYRKEIISNPEVKLERSQDEIFLKNLVSSINSRLDDASFKMEELAGSLNMGYSSLYRRCQALTGHSLVDFVRLLRLKKSAILITKYGYNISEAAYMSGFNDPKYFSKCFKKEFKKSPVDFKKEAQKIGTSLYLKKHKLDADF